MKSIKLTSLSNKGGCGCKLSSGKLQGILSGFLVDKNYDKRIIVGNSDFDDSSVIEQKQGNYILNTVDILTPIVDDPFVFGKVAALHSISDIYAMGGTPISALGIWGWPVDKDLEIAKQIYRGLYTACEESKVLLIGGHSIENEVPFFGLSVTGTIQKKNVKRNNTIQENDILYISKPLGVGILSTAEKLDILESKDQNSLYNNLLISNELGKELGEYECVTALTDITGNGFIGHLSEMITNSKFDAVIDYEKVPAINNLQHYIQKSCLSSRIDENWEKYKGKSNITELDIYYQTIFCDPQTNGGLLLSVNPNSHDYSFFQRNILENNRIEQIGYITKNKEQRINFSHD